MELPHSEQLHAERGHLFEAGASWAYQQFIPYLQERGFLECENTTESLPAAVTAISQQIALRKSPDWSLRSIDVVCKTPQLHDNTDLHRSVGTCLLSHPEPQEILRRISRIPSIIQSPALREGITEKIQVKMCTKSLLQILASVPNLLDDPRPAVELYGLSKKNLLGVFVR